MNPEIAKWRVAHAEIDLPDVALESVAPFPSLYANDFVAYLSGKGSGDEIVTFVRDLSRELVWAYDLVAKYQRESDLAHVFEDMLNNCSYPAEYQLTHRFIRDYAKAHGIQLASEAVNVPAWHGILLPGGEVTENNA